MHGNYEKGVNCFRAVCWQMKYILLILFFVVGYMIFGVLVIQQTTGDEMQNTPYAYMASSEYIGVKEPRKVWVVGSTRVGKVNGVIVKVDLPIPIAIEGTGVDYSDYEGPHLVNQVVLLPRHKGVTLGSPVKSAVHVHVLVPNGVDWEGLSNEIEMGDLWHDSWAELYPTLQEAKEAADW